MSRTIYVGTEYYQEGESNILKVFTRKRDAETFAKKLSKSRSKALMLDVDEWLVYVYCLGKLKCTHKPNFPTTNSLISLGVKPAK